MHFTEHFSPRSEVQSTSGFFFWPGLCFLSGVGGLVLLLAIGEILNTIEEVERISKTHFFEKFQKLFWAFKTVPLHLWMRKMDS